MEEEEIVDEEVQEEEGEKGQEEIENAIDVDEEAMEDEIPDDDHKDDIDDAHDEPGEAGAVEEEQIEKEDAEMSVPIDMTQLSPDGAAIIIQRRARGMSQRNVVAEKKERGELPGQIRGQQEHAAVKIQQRARGMHERKKVAELRQKGELPGQQRHKQIRQERSPSGSAMAMTEDHEAAAIKIQQRARGMTERKRVAGMRERGELPGQRRNKNNEDKAESPDAEYVEDNIGSGRNSAVGSALGMSQDHEAAAIKIQQRARGMKERKRVAGMRERGELPGQARNKREEMSAAGSALGMSQDHEAAAIKIQQRARGMKERKRVAGMRERGELPGQARNKMQGRASAASSDVGMSQDHEAAAIKIQQRARGMTERKRVAGMRERGELPGQARNKGHASVSGDDSSNDHVRGGTLQGRSSPARAHHVGFADDDQDEDVALWSEKPHQKASPSKSRTPPKRAAGSKPSPAKKSVGFADEDGRDADIEWGNWTDEHVNAAVKIQSRARGMKVRREVRAPYDLSFRTAEPGWLNERINREIEMEQKERQRDKATHDAAAVKAQSKAKVDATGRKVNGVKQGLRHTASGSSSDIEDGSASRDDGYSQEASPGRQRDDQGQQSDDDEEDVPIKKFGNLKMSPRPADTKGLARLQEEWNTSPSQGRKAHANFKEEGSPQNETRRSGEAFRSGRGDSHDQSPTSGSKDSSLRNDSTSPKSKLSKVSPHVSPSKEMLSPSMHHSPSALQSSPNSISTAQKSAAIMTAMEDPVLRGLNSKLKQIERDIESQQQSILSGLSFMEGGQMSTRDVSEIAEANQRVEKLMTVREQISLAIMHQRRLKDPDASHGHQSVRSSWDEQQQHQHAQGLRAAPPASIIRGQGRKHVGLSPRLQHVQGIAVSPERAGSDSEESPNAGRRMRMPAGSRAFVERQRKARDQLAAKELENIKRIEYRVGAAHKRSNDIGRHQRELILSREHQILNKVIRNQVALENKFLAQREARAAAPPAMQQLRGPGIKDMWNGGGLGVGGSLLSGAAWGGAGAGGGAFGGRW